MVCITLKLGFLLTIMYRNLFMYFFYFCLSLEPNVVIQGCRHHIVRCSMIGLMRIMMTNISVSNDQWLDFGVLQYNTCKITKLHIHFSFFSFMNNCKMSNIFINHLQTEVTCQENILEHIILALVQTQNNQYMVIYDI